MAPGLLDRFLVAVVVCLFGLGAVRATSLFMRGVQVLAVDRQRTFAEGVGDLIALAGFGLWVYEVLAFGWPLERHLVPAALRGRLFESVALQGLGVVVILAGLVIWLAAMSAMGGAWRIGIDRRSPGTLVTHGIFAWTRNPIYVAFDLLLIGTFLVQGRLLFLVPPLLVIPMLHLLIKREERFLARLRGDGYRDYRARVGRYITLRTRAHDVVREARRPRR